MSRFVSSRETLRYNQDHDDKGLFASGGGGGGGGKGSDGLKEKYQVEPTKAGLLGHKEGYVKSPGFDWNKRTPAERGEMKKALENSKITGTIQSSGFVSLKGPEAEVMAFLKKYGG